MESTYSSHSSGNGSDKASANGSDKTSASASTSTSSTSGTAAAAKNLYGDAKGAAQRTASTMRSELSNLKNDLDALMSRAPNLSDEELSQAQAQLMSKFSSMRYAAKGMANEASRQINRGMETTTEYVKDRPMQSVAVAVGAGLLLGMLFGRR